MCVYLVANLCAGRIGLGWAHDAITFACHMFMHSHAYVLYIQYIVILFYCLGLFQLSLSPSFSSVCVSLLLWPPNANLLRLGTLCFGASTYSNPTPFSIWFCDKKAKSDFFENFSRWGVHSECQVILLDFSDTYLPTVICSRGWDSLCDISVTCPSMLIQEFYSNMHGFDYLVPLLVTRVWGTHIVVTPDIVSDVLRVPRVEHPDYPSCDRLRTMSKDELISSFCEHPSDWGDRQFTSCTAFAKGPRFLNMVMTFVLHPLSHYNSITEPRTQFLLSLFLHLSIDFPSHFIISIIDVHRDSATHDKLIFPSAITRILRHFSIPFPLFDHFHIMGAINATTVKRRKA